MQQRLFLALPLLIISCYFSVSAKAAAPKKEVPPTIVEAVTVKAQEWQEQIPATGTLLASQGAMLRAETAGRVTKVYFQPGAMVKEGAELIDINPGILEGQLHSQEAQLKLNEANYHRGEQLYRKQLFPKAEIDKQLALLNASKAEVASAQARLSQAKVKAPFAGKVGLNKVSVGEYVNSGQELVSVQSLDPMRIDFSVPEIFSSRLAIDQAVNVTVSSYPGQIFQGKITGIDSMIDPKTRSIAVRVFIPNKEQKLFPGAFAEIKLFLGQKRSVLTIPEQAVFYDQGKTFVFKVINNKAVQTEVKLGTRINSDIVVEHGINANEKIISAGQIKLKDQASVIVKPAAG